MLAFFAWLDPRCDRAMFDKIRNGAAEVKCREYYKEGKKLSQDQFDVEIDRLTWVSFCEFINTYTLRPLLTISITVRICLKEIPAPKWPWGGYYPKDDISLVGEAKQCEKWKADHEASLSKPNVE